MTTKIDDHVLLLQLERQYDAVEERVQGLEKDADENPCDYCDCDCHEADISHMEDVVSATRQDLQSDIDALNDQLQELNEKYIELVHTLRGRGIPA